LPERPEARRVMLGTLFSALGNGLTLPFLYVYLHQVRGIDPTIVGLVVAWMGLLSLCIAGPVGWLIDHFGVRRVLVPLYCIAGLGAFSWGWDHTAWQALGSATLAAGVTGTFLGMNTLINSVTSEVERHRVFSLNFMLLNLGIGVGGIIAGFIANVHHVSSFRLLYTINAVTWLIPAFIVATLPSSVGGRLVSHKEATTAGGYREVFANRPFRRIVCFGLLLMACGYAQIEVGLPAFATTVGKVSTHVIAWGLVVNTAVIVVGQLAMTRRLEGRSRTRALAVAAAIVGLAWVLLGVGCFSRSFGGDVLPVIGIVACGGVFAIAETIFSPLQPALNNALATDDLRGRYNAIGSMTFGITSVIGPITAAPLIGNGLGGVWLVLIVAGSLGAGLVALSVYPMLTPQQDGRELTAESGELVAV
jgi:MFS family permease